MNVALFPGAPGFKHALRVLHHGFGIGGDTRAVKRGLHQAALSQPEIAFAGEQPLAKNVPVGAQHAALDVAARVANQHFFDGAGMIDENAAEIHDADARHVAVVTREPGKELERILV